MVVFKTILDVLEAQRDKEEPALICADERLTYREMVLRARGIAEGLLSRGVKKGDRIVVTAPKSADMVCAIFGIFYAGAVFVPTDKRWPEERLDFVKADTGCSLVLDEKLLREITEEKHLKLSSRQDGKIINKNDNQVTAPEVGDIPSVSPDDTAAVFYTSGSTGNPKGVVIHHKALQIMDPDSEDNEVFSHCRVYHCIANFTYVLALLECISAFNYGRCILVSTDEELASPALLASSILKYQVDIFSATPSVMLRLMELPFFKEPFSKLKYVALTGEAASPDALERISAATGACVQLHYGSTEMLRCAAFFFENGEDILLGRYPHGVMLYILNENGEIAEPDSEGEICISSPASESGYYLNQPELTAEKYIDHPELGRLFRSGDYGVRTKEGNIKLLGRNDGMIKLSGQRIEISEIESAMESFPGVIRAAACLKKVSGNDALCGFFTAESEIDDRKLRDHLASKLPVYMIPSFLKKIEEFPENTSGKIDRGRLPDISVTANNAAGPDDKSASANNAAGSDGKSASANNAAGPDDKSASANNAARPDDKSASANNAARPDDKSASANSAAGPDDNSVVEVMKESRPKVSVLTPIHNTDISLVRRAAESLTSQSYGLEHIEWIIGVHNMDESYLDDIRKQFEKISCVRIFSFNEPEGRLGAIRNELLDHAGGEYIFWLDADDEFTNDCILRVTKVMDKFNSDMTLFTITEKIDDGDRFISRSANIEGDAPYFYKKGDPNTGLCFSGGGINVWTWCYKNSFIKNNKLKFDTSEFSSLCDVEFVTQSLSLAEKTGILPGEPCYIYHMHSDSDLQNRVSGDKIRETCEAALKLLEKTADLENEGNFDLNCFRWNLICAFISAFTSPALSAEEKENLHEKLRPWIAGLKAIDPDAEFPGRPEGAAPDVIRAFFPEETKKRDKPDIRHKRISRADGGETVSALAYLSGSEDKAVNPDTKEQIYRYRYFHIIPDPVNTFKGKISDDALPGKEVVDLTKVNSAGKAEERIRAFMKMEELRGFKKNEVHLRITQFALSENKSEILITWDARYLSDCAVNWLLNQLL